MDDITMPISKTAACFQLLMNRIGPVTEIHVTTNHDEGEEFIVVENAKGEKAILCGHFTLEGTGRIHYSGY